MHAHPRCAVSSCALYASPFPLQRSVAPATTPSLPRAKWIERKCKTQKATKQHKRHRAQSIPVCASCASLWLTLEKEFQRELHLPSPLFADVTSKVRRVVDVAVRERTVHTV